MDLPEISRPVDFNTRAVAMDYFGRARFHPSCWKVPYFYRFPEYKARFMNELSSSKIEFGYAKRPIWDLGQYPADPLVFIPVDWRNEIEFIKRRAKRATEWEQYEMGATRNRQAGYTWLFKNDEDFREFELMIRRELVSRNNFEIEERVKASTTRFKNICSIYERDNPFSAPRESSGEFERSSSGSSLTLSDDSRYDQTNSTLSLGGPESHFREREYDEFTTINGKPVVDGYVVEWDNIPSSHPVHRDSGDSNL